MKKTIISALFAIMALTASAQKELFSCSLIGGYTHTNDPKINTAAFGASMTFYNVYFGILFNPADQATTTNVGVWGNQWQIYNYHLGYRFAIKNKKIGIIPIIGATSSAVGYVDGYDWKVNSNGIVNKFNATNKGTYFDAGIVLDYSHKKSGSLIGYKILAGATLHTIFAGIGITM